MRSNLLEPETYWKGSPRLLLYSIPLPPVLVSRRRRLGATKVRRRGAATPFPPVRRQFRGSIGSDGFEKVLIGTRGPREANLDGAKGRAAKNSVSTMV